MKKVSLIGFCFILTSQLADANPFCFARATSYYEQVYCELERKAQTKSIPPFEEFRKTTESIQYSLLKRIADKNYIELPKPATKVIAPEAIEQKQVAVSPVNQVKIKNSASSGRINSGGVKKVKASPSETQSCRISDHAIICGAQTFQLMGNRSNHKLKQGVLTEDYRMGLHNYANQENLNSFLAAAYNEYLIKMSDIGLGGVTMTYSKFVYFYNDIQSKNLNFSKRFETMYTYLKKDKASMNASERIVFPKGLSLSDCDQFSQALWACDISGTNYLFQGTFN